MTTKKKTWKEKLETGKEAKVERMTAAMRGLQPGAKLLIVTPKIVDEYIRNIPKGDTVTPQEMRADLAKRFKAAATCPISTSIFIRIAAEAAWDELEAGASAGKVTPFWRVVEPNSTIAKKLRTDSAWIAHQRHLEAGKSSAQKTSQ